MAAKCGSVWRFILRFRNQILVIVIPLLLLPLPLVLNDERATVGYVTLLMASFWVLQVIPIAITSLMPFFIFPMLGILTVDEISKQIFKEYIVTFMSGYITANAMQMSGLHKRIALNVVLLTGSKQSVTFLGLILPAFLMSMWMSNLAMCILMVSIADQIVSELQDQALKESKLSAKANIEIADKAIIKGKSYGYVNEGITLESITPKEKAEDIEAANIADKDLDNNELNSSDVDSDTDESEDESENSPISLTKEEKLIYSWFKNLKACYVLGIAYSSTLGGMATISGAPPNLVTKNLVDKIWIENGFTESPINFSSWIILYLPSSVIAFLFIWGWFIFHFFVLGSCSLKRGALKYSKLTSDSMIESLRKELDLLGSFKYSEYVAAFMIAATILLWFFLNPDFMNGWATKFPAGYVTLAVPATLTMVAMFIIPGQDVCSKSKSSKPVAPMANFKNFIHNFPWDVMLLVGGGNALAEAINVSGLSAWMADGLSGMNTLPVVLIMFILALMVSIMTEVIANIVTLNIFIPIAGQLAESLGKNPLYLIFPVAQAANFSFVLPMAGAVNAWILTTGGGKVRDSIRAGPPINVFCVLVTMLSMHTWGDAYFDFDTIPWNTENSTVSANTTMALL